ncbi:Histidine kinase [Filimonas lacunae]|uniref:Histidine kinase n=1 Tax=Filimonas lacunae TaxID=477680 RepID=A0A1N7NCX6_9BACT|nr:sensor histidine kinase [Filimonas lacunae]SIS96166.1 Histidine kinase [Filimonas lacunae]
MQRSRRVLTYQQKSLVAECVFLLVIGVLSPFAVGWQIYPQLSFILSLVLLNIFQLPAIVLFYRVYLPYTIGKGRYWLGVGLFPLYILVYELGSRLSSILLIHVPLIPQGYRQRLASAHPENLTQGYFNQSLGYTCLVLLAASSLYVVKLLFKNQHHLHTVATQKLQLELGQLKNQVQPHFFFNTLNNIYSLSVQQSPDAPRMIEGLSAIMRYVLYECSHDTVPLEQEVAFIKNYIHLENLRHSATDVIDFSIQGTISGTVIEPLLLMPLIENTFKHALHQHAAEKWVKLVLSVDEKELIFQTCNPQNQPHMQTANPYGGIGLANVRKRLALLYPGRHDLVIHDEPETFTVTLVISFT